MEKLIKYLMLMLVTTLSLTFASCGGDDEDEPDKPDTPTPSTTSKVTKGKISFPGWFEIFSEDNDIFCCRVDVKKRGGVDLLCVSKGDYLKIIYVGNINSLNEIKSLPTPGTANTWDHYDQILYEKGGYIIEGAYRGDLYHVRLYIPKKTYNVMGETVGVSYEYQYFEPTN